MMRIHKPILPLLAAVLMSGCADVKQEIGLGRQSPDEFAVVTRAPLSIPPSFDLRPPQPGSVRPQEGSTRQTAQQLIFTTAEQAQQNSSAKSDAEMALLRQSGAAEANPNIRELVGRDLGQVDVEDPYIGRRLLFWKDNPNAVADTIDPVEEAKRLKQEAQPEETETTE